MITITREICKICHNVNRVGFSVPNEVWNLVTNYSYFVWCLDCFTKIADEQFILWDKDIKFYPVSFKSHIQSKDIDKSKDNRILAYCIHCDNTHLVKECLTYNGRYHGPCFPSLH